PYKKSDFAKLLWEINQMPGIERIHWTAPHPLYMTDEVIDARSHPKQVNYIHLPVQSGNNDVLKQMNRRYTREIYLEVIAKMRAKKPNIAIGTDIIVGFCGETESQFDDTVSLYRACDFDISYHAQYSERTGTVAWRAFDDDVPREEKKRRWETLQTLMEETTLRKNQCYVSQTVSVLADEWSAGWCAGNSHEMKRIRWKGDVSCVGSIVPVEIFKAEEWILWGRVI
ncbi:MAG: radical SAM protein, partial [Patescibacteria group bacterium]